jgi:hypothetical protein
MTLVPMHFAAAQAASPQVINLSCSGTRSIEPFSIEPVTQSLTQQGITVNFTDGTVAGAAGVVLHITKADDATIEFSGQGIVPPNAAWGEVGPSDVTALGSIDRVTGQMSVTANYAFHEPSLKAPYNKTLSIDNLTCRVTNRLL